VTNFDPKAQKIRTLIYSRQYYEINNINLCVNQPENRLKLVQLGVGPFRRLPGEPKPVPGLSMLQCNLSQPISKIFINSYLLYLNNFSYVFRPIGDHPQGKFR
jgi:hypothetical protein